MVERRSSGPAPAQRVSSGARPTSRTRSALSDFFENANVGFSWVGTDGVILRANRAQLDLLGYARGEYLARHIADFHVDPGAAREILQRFAKGEELRGHPVRLRCKDGTIKDVLIHSTAYRDADRIVHTRCVTIDAGPRRLADEAQALLAAVVEHSDDAIVTKSLDGIITSWNGGAERIFGYTREEAVGQPITMIIPPDLADEERDLIDRIRRGERIAPFETRRLHKHGHRLDVSVRISPVRDRYGRIVGASKLACDITAKLRAERALRESEGRFRQLAENAPAAIFVKDLEGRYTMANPLARQILGRSDAVLGLTDFDLLPADVAKDLRRRDLEVMETGKAIESEEVVVRPGFRHRYLSVKFPLFDAGGGTVGVCGVAIDITDRKRWEEALRESEERFRTLADNISPFAWMADGNGWIFWYNQRWFEYTGTTLEEMEGWGWRSVHHPDHVDRVVEKISACFESGEPWEDTFPLRGVDGRYRWFLSRAIPIRDAEGRVTRWFGTNTDVTDQRRAEEALVEADRRKDEFIATLAHELRNPLAPIRTSLEILKSENLDAQSRRDAQEVVDRQMAQLEHLVDDLLDIARIQRDQLTLRRKRIELRPVIEQSVETCRALAASNHIELSVDLPADPIQLDADAVRLTQVFSNLLTNACRYTPPSGRVALEARREGDQLAVVVRDEGRGIPREMLSRVFEMFARVDDADDGNGGLGIGLTLVRRLVEMHGGRIEAFSDGIGRGSRFEVHLPLASAPAAERASPPRTRPGQQRQRRILVVDDNVDAADSLAKLAELWGHEVSTAHDGETAVRAAEAFRPDIVMLDIGLPGIDGHGAARRIREQPWGRSMVLVALTGWGQDEDRRRSRETGFDHHFVKPVDVETLREFLAGPNGG